MATDGKMIGQRVSELPELPSREPDSHKGSYGRVLIVAGSRGMSGAAVLCGSAALRSGAGLVELAVPSEILPIVAMANPCYLTLGLAADDQGRLREQCERHLLDHVQLADVLAIGPGLGRSAEMADVVRCILRETVRTVVVDADALNALVEQLDVLDERPAPTILTPHPGEFARLVGLTTEQVQRDRLNLALQFASRHNVILVLKGHGTIVTDGQRFFENSTGNPGMATGGTGDVLTGMIAALVAQGLPPFEAAQLGVYLHGLAGDLASVDMGEIALIASDLINYLPRAFRSLTN